MLLGLENDVNRATASEFGGRGVSWRDSCRWRGCWRSTSRAMFSASGWGGASSSFVFNELESRDEATELQIQMELLKAGVLTVNEVRAMRGLAG